MPKPPATTRADSHPDLMVSLTHTDKIPTACRAQVPQLVSGDLLLCPSVFQHRGNVSYPWLKLRC